MFIEQLIYFQKTMSKDKSKSPQPDAGGGDEEGGFVSTS